jgi:hypothetical protein
MRATSSICVLLSAIVALAALSCADETSEPRPAVQPAVADTSFAMPEAVPGRRTAAGVGAQLDGRGPREHIVASGPDSAEGTIDRIEIYQYASAREGYRVVFADTIAAGSAVNVQDVTGDGLPDVVVPLRQRGNDPITSFGLHIYSADGDGIRRVFRSQWMNPQIDSLVGWKGRTIVTHRELWPLFVSHADAEVFVDDVFAFEEGRYRSIAREIPRFFRDRSRAQLQRYRAISDTLTTDSVRYADQVALFRSAALVMVNLVKGGDRDAARRFWLREKEFLAEALDEPQFDELEEMAGHLTMF